MNTSITPLIQYHPGVVAVKALVHDKTQLMLISRRADFAPKRPNIQPRDPASNLRKKLRYLVLISTKTSETVRNTEKTAYVASLASMPVGTRHYKSQVNPVLENSLLVWSPCPPSYLSLLEKIQDRAKRLIQRRRTSTHPSTLQSLQQCRNVSGLCTRSISNTRHPASLLLPRSPHAPYNTKLAQSEKTR